MALMLAGDKEKKAASDPEIKAENKSKTRIAISETKRSILKGFTLTLNAVLITW
jgi:hypothetical protein